MQQNDRDTLREFYANEIRSKPHMAEHVLDALLRIDGRPLAYYLTLDSEVLADQYLDAVERDSF